MPPTLRTLTSDPCSYTLSTPSGPSVYDPPSTRGLSRLPSQISVRSSPVRQPTLHLCTTLESALHAFPATEYVFLTEEDVRKGRGRARDCEGWVLGMVFGLVEEEEETEGKVQDVDMDTFLEEYRGVGWGRDEEVRRLLREPLPENPLSSPSVEDFLRGMEGERIEKEEPVTDELRSLSSYPDSQPLVIIDRKTRELFLRLKGGKIHKVVQRIYLPKRETPPKKASKSAYEYYKDISDKWEEIENVGGEDDDIAMGVRHEVYKARARGGLVEEEWDDCMI